MFKWNEQHQKAIVSGYAGSIEEYIELYNYVKSVIRECNAGFDVSPTKVNGFQVEPTTATNNDIITTHSTFTVTPFSPSGGWMGEMKKSIIESQVKGSFTVEVSPRFEELKQREQKRDEQLRERRKSTLTAKVKLPPNVTQIVQETWRKDPDAVLISKFGIDFTTKDLATLKSGVWLNDEVINFYMQLIQERSNQAHPRLPSVHVFSTFFYPKLIKSGYSAVRTSTRRITPSVLTRNLILIPIHLTAHWCMACIDMEGRKISYYDSLGGNNVSCLTALKQWLSAESEDKLGMSIDLSDWKMESCHVIPHQQNGSDCGVFAITFAEHLSRKASFSFNQQDMPQFRFQIAYEILQGTLLAS